MEDDNLRLPTSCDNKLQGRRLIVDNSATYDMSYWHTGDASPAKHVHYFITQIFLSLSP